MERIADGTEREWVVELMDTVAAWTITQYRLHDDDPRKTRVYSLPFGRGDFVGDWLGWLASVLRVEETERRFLTSLRKLAGFGSVDQRIPNGLTEHQLVKDSIPWDVGRLWRRVAERVMPAVPLEAHRWTFLSQDQEEALYLLVQVRHGRAVLTEHWLHARGLADVYDQWVAHVAHCHDFFRALVTFLGAGVSHLDASSVTR